MKAGLDRADELAEAQHDTLLVRIHPEEGGIGENGKNEQANHENGATSAASTGTGRSARTRAAAENLTQLFLRPPDHLVQIRRLITATATLRSLPPWPPAAAATLPAAAAVLVLPGHQESFDCEVIDRLETHIPGVI